VQKEIDQSAKSVKQVQDQIKLEDDRQKILKDRFTAESALLLTDKQQEHEAGTLRDQYHDTTGALKDLYTKAHDDLVPEVQKAYNEFHILQGDLAVLNDPQHMKGVLDSSFNVKGSFDRITTAADAAAAHLTTLSQTQANINPTGGVGTSPYGPPTPGSPHPLPTVPSLFPPTILTDPLHPGAHAFASGGFTDSPTFSMLSENAKPEIVLPLSDPSRSRELLSSLPPSLLASIGPRGGSTYQINASATGATLDDMRAAAHAAVDEAFARARTSSRRSGALVTAGIG
jgi:hypothetical protein